MAHADANTERDTTVANSNLTELLKADAAKHQLTAQKYSADGLTQNSSYQKTILVRKRKG